LNPFEVVYLIGLSIVWTTGTCFDCCNRYRRFWLGSFCCVRHRCAGTQSRRKK